MEKIIQELKDFSAKNRHIKSTLIVGSYARGTNREDSDLDVVIITSKKDEMVENQQFVECFGEVKKKQIEYYGACTSIRVWYKDGQEVEFGIVTPTWMDKPLDEGTRKVLSDGYLVIEDKEKYFEDLVL